MQIVELLVPEVIILSDSEDFPWYRCDEKHARAPFMIALPAPSQQFECAATIFPKRLYDFFIVEELSCLAVPDVDAARVARAAYMSGWHARARNAACAVPRRSCCIAQRDL